MNIHVNLNIKRNILEEEIDNTVCSVIGHMVNSNYKELYFSTLNNMSEFSKYLESLKGFFAVIIQSKEKIYAAVDHTRSIPLFYAQINEDFYLSTSASWIKNNLKSYEINELAKEEFQMLGYVLGDKTLHPIIKQLRAGEYLKATEDKLEVKKYYEFKHTSPKDFNKKFFNEKLDETATNSVERLINYANGKQIVVPLSGGYDSRLIVSLLRKLNYDNVICFSYGVEGNKEANYSKKIAEALGYKWIFIEYREDLWKQCWFSDEAEDFREYSSNLSSLPHIQDWLALTELKNSGRIDLNSIFVPGHCCVTGFIPSEKLLNNRINKKKHFLNIYLDYIINTHFIGRPFSKNSLLTIDKVKEILALNRDIQNIDDTLSEVMKYNWSERQSKYITNSVRSYEFLDFDWWLPLWDQDFTKLWELVPIEHRIRRSIYVDYVNKTFYESSIEKIDITDNASNRTLIRHVLSAVIPKVLPVFVLKRFKRKRYRSVYINHILKFGSLVQPSELEYYIENDYNIIGMYSDLFLNDKWGK
jgi:asparagine synthase (glutamine-hydrolysing)